MTLKDFLCIFNPVLEQVLEEKLKTSYDILKEKELQKILNYTKDFILWWGKRIRPYLLFAMYKAFGGRKDNEILKFGTGFELRHAFALIHDDIMDEWDTRRNIKTYHKYIQSITQNVKSEHYWISQAILMWDLVFNWANEIVFDNYDLDVQKLGQVRKNYLEMSRETIFGQIIDVSLTLGEKTNKDTLDKKNLLKTSKYTFVKPMVIWAILWGAQTLELHKIEELWKYLGSAFQIRDDLKDVLESAQKSWKTCFSDVKEWQQTVLTYYILEKGSEDQKTFLQHCMWRDLSKQDIDQLKNIFEESWAIDYGFGEIKKNLSQAQKILDTINFVDISYKKTIEEILDLIWK